MEHDNPVVGGKPKIAFDPRPAFKRGGERDQAVFRKSGAVVQAAMGEACRARI